MLALEVRKPGDKPVSFKKYKEYRSVSGIANYMVQWSWLDCINPQRELSQHLNKPTDACMEAQQRMINFIVGTEARGYTNKPDNPGSWDGSPDYVFKISGESDSEYAKDPSRRSVNSGETFLCGALVKMFSKMMPVVALSSMEAELYSIVLTAMDMVFVYHIMRSMGLAVELPMILYADNQGAIGFANNWSVGGRTRHINTKQTYIRELKENGLIKLKHRKGTELIVDNGTKNTQPSAFNQQANQFMSYPDSDEEVKIE